MGPLKPGPGLDRGVSSRLRWLFLVASLALLATAIWATVAEQRAEWRVLQRRFRALESKTVGGGAGEEGETPGLQQVWLADIDRVDRCTSCHLGIADPAMRGAPSPFRSHPGRWLETHRPDRYGCTLCHGGQGEATSYRGAAHRPIPDWSQPIVSRELMESRCGTCHRERNPRATSWLARGRATIADRNCIACHEIPGYDVSELRAPRLDGLPLKVAPSWLRAWLEKPSSYLPKTRMGNFRLPARDVEGLSAFLLGQPRTPALAPVDFSKASVEKGGELFRRSRCVTCHEVNDRGGTLAPALTHVGAKVSREWLFSWVSDPQRLQPKTLMPRFRFADDEARDLAAYLASEFSDPPQGFGASRSAPDASLAQEGRRVFERRACTSCHDLEGFPKLARIGPKLTAVGDRVLEPAPLVARGIAPTVPNWIYTKVRGPEQVLEAARMPTFGFSEQDGAALAVALLSLRAREMPPSRTTRDPVRPVYEPQGEFGALVRRYRCLSCHMAQGTGGTLSTVVFDRIGSQLRRDQIERFVQKPYGIRVSLQERMPQLDVTPEEARTLAGYLSTVMVDDALETAVPSDRQTVARGLALFAAHGCIACHIAGEKGGYVGPELNGSAARLKPGWVVAWLTSPQRWKPGTLEPDRGLSRADAEALAAYVLSLPARKAKGATP